jgi:hypothetical protein
MGVIKTQREDYFQKTFGEACLQHLFPWWERAGERGKIIIASGAKQSCFSFPLFYGRIERDYFVGWAAPTKETLI